MKWDVSIKVMPLVLKMESDRSSPANAFGSIQNGESNDWWSIHYLDGVIPLDSHGEDVLWSRWLLFWCMPLQRLGYFLSSSCSRNRPEIEFSGGKWYLLDRPQQFGSERDTCGISMTNKHILCRMMSPQTILSPASSWPDTLILNPPVIANSSWPLVKVRI